MSAAFYRSPAWKRMRAACLARDPVCRSPGCGRPSSHADHLVPRAKGGADALPNLQGLCESCHNARTGRGNGELRTKGCDVSGRPLDPGHWWNS